MAETGRIIEAMIEYYGTDIRRINHFLKVFSFAKTIGEGENLDDKSLDIVEATAVLHDIGIKLSEEKYNSSAGKYQEKEGPAEAEKLLSKLGYDRSFIDSVCYIIARHHTYNNIDTLPYQIIVEADFLVNLYEDSESRKAAEKVFEKIFRTKTGKKLMKKMYLSD